MAPPGFQCRVRRGGVISNFITTALEWQVKPKVNLGCHAMRVEVLAAPQVFTSMDQRFAVGFYRAVRLHDRLNTWLLNAESCLTSEPKTLVGRSGWEGEARFWRFDT